MNEMKINGMKSNGMKLNDMERRGVISNYKKIDKNAKFYTEMKNNHQDEIKNKLLFVNMMTYNITSTICLVSYDKTILFPVIGLQFIKYVENKFACYDKE